MVKSDFLQFSVTDFILDESFQRWVKQPQESPDKDWANWLMLFPEKSAVVEQAKSFINELMVELDELVSLEEAEEVWLAIDSRLV